MPNESHQCKYFIVVFLFECDNLSTNFATIVHSISFMVLVFHLCFFIKYVFAFYSPQFFLTMGEFRICIVIGFLIEVIIKPSDLIFLAVDKFIQDVIKSVYIFIVSWSVIIIIERYVAGSSLILFSLLMISKLSQKWSISDRF